MLTRRLRGLLTAALAFIAVTADGFACSAFSIAGDGLVLFADNEDFWDPDTKMWFVQATDGSYGRVYFGYEGLLPEGGLNEAGLAYGGYATPSKPVLRGQGKPAVSERELIDTAMSTCATVDEVVRLFDRFSLQVMEPFMLMFADRTGASVIIEGDEVLRKVGSFQVVTNFHQSEHPDGKEAYPGGESCTRFQIATDMLREMKAVTLDAARGALAAIHAEGRSKTLYSVIYELGSGRAHVYHYHDFSHEVVIDLAAELERGARVIDLPTLFPRSFAYETFANEQAVELERRRAERSVAMVPPEQMARYVGSYQGPEGGLTISMEEGRLIADAVGLPQVLLTPASATSFLAVRFIGDAELEFRLGPEDQIQGVELRTGDHQTFLERLP